ncbi:MAG: hypothetical protein IKX39_06525 [Muribaculaceae bacterium]|nr:hypothetical protein [Muribaculaceae bacterium]
MKSRLMKKSIILLAAAMLTWAWLPAQTSKTFDEGYVFVSPLKSHSKKSLKSRVKSTIPAGRVAVKSSDSPRELTFSLVDAAEYFTIENGAFYKYYPPAQEDVPAEYVSKAEFNKATRKVKIFSEAPTSIERGKPYTFVSQCPDEYRNSVIVRVIRLPNSDMSLVTEVDYENDFTPSRSVDISGKTIMEITMSDNIVYLFNGQQVMLESNLGGRDYSTLVVDEHGVPYAKDDSGNRRAVSKLSYVLGEIPEIGYSGWISDSELVIDDKLYVPAKPGTH